MNSASLKYEVLSIEIIFLFRILIKSEIYHWNIFVFQSIKFLSIVFVFLLLKCGKMSNSEEGKK